MSAGTRVGGLVLAAAVGMAAPALAQPPGTGRLPPMDEAPALDPPADPVTDEPEAPVEAPGAAGGNADVYGSLPPLDLPPVGPDTLAFGHSFQMVSANLTAQSFGQASNEVADETLTYSLSASTRYFQSLERRAMAWSVLASAADSLARTPAGDGSLYNNTLSLSGSPEGRLYPNAGSLLFLHTAIDFSATVSSTKQTGTVSASDSNGPGTFGVVVGGGYGRVLAIDPVVRLRRLEQALQARGALSGGIPTATGNEIVRTWYALRNDLGLYKTLAYTMKHLDQAGLLAGDPDLRATYEALQILGDPFIVDRRNGWDARGGLGLLQPFTAFDDLDEPDMQVALLGSAQWERPLDTTRQLSLRGKALFDVGDSDTGARPYSLRFFGTYTEVFYTETYDPTGSLSLVGEVGAAGLRVPGDDPDIGLDLLGSAAYSRALNRGSLATGALSMSVRNDGVYSITLSLGITWGIASGYFTLYQPAAAGL